MLLGVDVGGTFTDAALLDGELLRTAKVPSTPEDQSRGVIAAVEEVLGRAGAEPADVQGFTHGMTVGTNALLEERGARTALVAPRAFADLLEIGRQNRPSLYHPCRPKPRPLVEPELKYEAAERIGAQGVVEELADEEIAGLVERVRGNGAESVAVCLLFAFSDPAHERRIASALREALPEVHVSSSHEVLPAFREYERFSTTVIDAYLSPLLGRYLGSLAAACRERGLAEPEVMRSSGGTADAAEAARSGAWSVLSGPAGGAVGAGLLARSGGHPDAIGIDMGGTSCDVCVVDAGEVRRTDSREIEGRPIQLPMVDVHTVGAGGGSIGWRDAGGALRVGPRSAGAEPGPACYGRGGTQATVTDADLLLGYLDDGYFLGGTMKLDRAAAERAVGEIANELRMDPLEAAWGIHEIVNEHMAGAARMHAFERGVDPRGYALLAFGGAGGLHAAAIADELGIDRVLCPRASGVLSALGLAVAERRADVRRTVLGQEPPLDELAAEARAALGDDDAEVRVAHDLRYRGQSFELTVPAGDDDRAAFEDAHEERYGYREPDAEVELVTVRVSAVRPGPRIDLTAGERASEPTGERETTLGRTTVFTGELGAGTEIEGPAVWQGPEATLAVPEGWRGTVDDAGTIVLERWTR